MGFLKAAERVLDDAGEPLHYREITQRALDRGILRTKGQTPWSTLNAQIAVSLRRKGAASPFIRVRPGVFGLRRWADDGKNHTEYVPSSGGQVMVPMFPIYDRTRAVLPTWVGALRSDITGMRSTIFALRGTPQSQVDWTDPDSWIDERLSGATREWALRTWHGTGKQVNPRHVAGHWLLATNYDLLEDDDSGRLALTTAGQEFLDAPAGATVQQIDVGQGLATILSLVADAGSASRAVLLEPWTEYLLAETNIRSDSAAKAHLWSRLRNLSMRGLVSRSGRSYVATSDGIAYLEQLGGAPVPELDDDQRLRKLLQVHQQEVREGIHGLLMEMDPYSFEHLIRQLLEEIGYEDVEVTSPSNDKGVDVVGSIELGITSVKEVVQVKRQAKNVARPVLDGLRGVLHRFGAVRGTIITTSDFTKGTQEAAFEAGAAPITLISGPKLIELLIEHEIGVKKRTFETWELDPSAFAGEDEASEQD